ncbi:ABC transporter ATP-binding protein [Aeoliella sp.]|uniref:ABC transporter ATP-binding protein n=1 Tax=Aeoliella sp. TaxID=2795800 RepID=UPI003CCBA90A
MMFQLNNVSKTYRRRQQQVVAFEVDSLAIDSGEYVAIVGPSGSGKTTLLSLLGGMLSPDEGEVLLDGHPMYELSVARRTELRRQYLGFVFQTFNLVPYLTALENVAIPLLLNGAPKAVQNMRAKELLEEVDLAERIDHKPSELSVGQQQRVALARTMANDPKVILADEPTGNLDPESREMVLSKFDEFVAEGRTIVTVTHDPAAASRAKRQLLITGGQLGVSVDRSLSCVA